jgi:beta-lactamase class D
MHKYILLLLLFCSAFAACGKQGEHGYETDLTPYFQNYKGSFVLYDLNNRYYIKHNEAGSTERFSPCSTFKIFNSLAALESGVIKDENEVIKWDSVDRGRPEWNKDHTLRSAFQVSAVWFYQELARRIGVQRMKGYIDSVKYGNMDISGGIDKFWLMSSLQISVNEQVDFVTRLYKNELPFSQKNMEAVRNIMVIEKDTLRSFSGKTGTGANLGWFTGSVQYGTNLYVFAINIQGEGASGMKARDISREILKSMKIL